MAAWTTILLSINLQCIQGFICCNDVSRTEISRHKYFSARPNYRDGLAVDDSQKIDTELVSNVIANLKRGKAIDIDGLSAEHFTVQSCVSWCCFV